jgi:hypothetical protein
VNKNVVNNVSKKATTEGKDTPQIKNIYGNN